MTESKRGFVLFGGERLFTFKSWALLVTSDAAFLRQSQKLAAAAGKGNSIFRFRYSSHDGGGNDFKGSNRGKRGHEHP